MATPKTPKTPQSSGGPRTPAKPSSLATPAAPRKPGEEKPVAASPTSARAKMYARKAAEGKPLPPSAARNPELVAWAENELKSANPRLASSKTMGPPLQTGYVPPRLPYKDQWRQLPPTPLWGITKYPVPPRPPSEFGRTTFNTVPGQGGSWRLYNPADFGAKGNPYYYWIKEGSAPGPHVPAKLVMENEPPVQAPYQYGSHEPPSTSFKV